LVVETSVATLYYVLEPNFNFFPDKRILIFFGLRIKIRKAQYAGPEIGTAWMPQLPRAKHTLTQQSPT
jgi:hypothetical protein